MKRRVITIWEPEVTEEHIDTVVNYLNGYIINADDKAEVVKCGTKRFALIGTQNTHREYDAMNAEVIHLNKNRKG